ncbi:hypothetical protein F5Y19DRAFT_470891 [Xylariaceae sp. FL1651]|nr:hypothetical protein F5Y19DRAFT_470891 [Xylariaceae sp. FL1651]
MAESEPYLGSNTPDGSPPWLRTSKIVNLSTRYSFTPYPEDRLNQYLADVDPVDKEIYVLDILQRTRTTSIGAPALQITLNALLDSAPQAIQDRVGLHMGGGPQDQDTGAVIGQPNWFSQSDEDFDRTMADFKNGRLPPLNSGNREFVLWVVNGGTPDRQHYATVVLHYEPSDPSKPQVFDRIGQWAVANPLDDLNGPFVLRFQAMLRQQSLLETQGISKKGERNIWTPLQEEGEEFASGLFAYSVVAQLLDRIGQMYSRGVDFDEEAFFAPTRPWFNPDAVRAEMLGRAAIKAMERLNWKARLALFPVGPFVDGQREGVEPSELAPSQVPPILHDLSDYDDLPEDYVKKENKSTQTKNGLTDTPENKSPQQSLKSPSPRIKPESPANPNLCGEAGDDGYGDDGVGAGAGDYGDGDGGDGDDGYDENSDGDEKEKQRFAFYRQLKEEDVEVLDTSLQAAEEIIDSARQRADEMRYTVLEAPVDNIPTAAAVQRLYTDIRLAEIALLRTISDRSSVRRVLNPELHNQIAEEMDLDAVDLNVKGPIEYLVDEYERAQDVYLDAKDVYLDATAARGALGVDYQLAEVLDVPKANTKNDNIDSNDQEEQEDKEKSEEKSEDDEEKEEKEEKEEEEEEEEEEADNNKNNSDDISIDSPKFKKLYKPQKNSKKRKFAYEIESRTEAEGREFLTLKPPKRHRNY